MTIPETGFIKNVNTIANKIAVIESANEIFDEGVATVLQEIALLDLDEAILDLKKGNYLGNRKLDINLALNMVGVTEDLLANDPDAAEAIWVDTAKAVHYSGATITFNDGVVISLPFLFDNSPTTISTHGDLITQLSRYDLTNAVRQVATISNVVAINNTIYTVTINSTVITYISDATASAAEISTGLVNAINLNPVPVTAAEAGNTFTLSADVVGTAFTASINGNMTLTATVPNGESVIAETAFLAKMDDTILASFATNVVGEIIRAYDVVGHNSNLERIQLHAVSGQFIDPNPIYYWAKTTSAFQTLSMRAGDIIKLGNDIDSIITLASRITEMLDLQNKMPQLVTNGDSLYTNIAKLVTIYEQLTGLVVVYNDVKVGGTNYINTNANDLALVDSKIRTVAEDLQLGNLSKIKIVKDAIASVVTVASSIANVNTVSTNIANVNTVATNIVAIQGASANASTSTTQAGIATTQAGIATTQASISTAQAVISTAQAVLATSKANSILGLTTQAATGAAGSLATVSYNPVDGKMTFSIPQGIQGIRGEAFTVNSVGLAADRPLYNTQVKGFSFLAIDAGLVYFKLSNTSADWSVGAPFGKGDQGDIGLTGNGISGINFLSTTHASGLAGQSGGTDTYKITTSNATTYNFLVYNGLNGILINDTTLSLIATWSNQKISNELGLKANLNNPTFTGTVEGITASMVGLGNVNNISDANKPISIAQATAINLKADTNSPTFTGTVGGITAAMVGAPAGSGNSSGNNTGDQDLSGKQNVLVSGTNIKTVNGQSLLGGGNLALASTSLSGTTTIYVGQVIAYIITDFDSFSTYAVSASAGSVTRTLDAISFTAPAVAGNVTLTVTTNGVARAVALTVLPATVAAPTITSPTNAATGVTGPSLTLTSSAFAWTGVSDTHLNSDWQLATDAGFTAIVQSTSADAANKTSWSTTVAVGTTYYVRVRHRGTANGASSYSATVTFSTAATFNSYITTPTATPAAFGDSFEGGFYTGMIWNELVQSASSHAIGTGSKAFVVSDMTATPLVYAGQTLEVRSRANPVNKMIGVVTGASGTALTINVTSVGGAGTFTDWSIMAQYRVIVAPKSTGENTSISYKNANTAAPVACGTLSEGRKATLAMVAADTSTVYPAAHWCNNLSIAGKTDWYLPARDELELCWRNLKPTADANHASPDRPTDATPNYQNLGSYGDTANTYGLSPNTSPAGAAHTSGVPAQVAAGKSFRTSESEAFGYGSFFYLSASEHSATHVWFQYWYSVVPGGQTYVDKTVALYARAVRRSII